MAILTPSPITQLEKAFQSLMSTDLPTPLNGNVLITDNNQRILHPCVLITTDSQSEELTPFSGVFKANLRIAYETKLSADQQTPDGAETEWANVMQVFYYTNAIGQSLAARLNAKGFAYVYGVVPRQIQQSVDEARKLWIKSILLECHYIAS